MISTLVKNDGSIVIASRGDGGIGGSLFNAKPHNTGGYYINWWYGIGNCFEYIGKLTDLISLAKSEESRIMKKPYRPYLD